MMKKLLAKLLLLLLVESLSFGVLAEGEEEILSGPVELTVPETEKALSAGEGDEDVGYVQKNAIAAAVGVEIDDVHFPDANFRKYVKENYDINQDGILSSEERESVTQMTVSFREISSLEGVEWFPSIKLLSCYQNYLTSLDVSKNTKLEELECDGNQLTSLDVSHNPEIYSLSCSENRLTSLDVRHNPKLRIFYCMVNRLTSLDVSHNPELRILDCFGNELTRLDVSRNTKLNNLDCYDNRLTSLDVSGAAALSTLECYGNRLTSLDVSRNTALTSLICYGNQLKVLDVSKNPDLNRLDCYLNQIQTVHIANGGYLISTSMEKPVKREDGFIEIGRHNDYGLYWGVIIDPSTSVVTNDKVFYGKMPINLSATKITIKNVVYTGKAIKPAVTVKYKGKALKKGTDYTVSYKNNKAIGKATVVVKGKGKYTGTVKKAFRINPKAVKGLKLKAGSKQITVSWKKDKTVTGYEIQYALNKSFKGAKKVTIKKAATVKTVIRKLKAKKLYYVRIRGYKTVKKVKYVSAWSKVLKVTTKK